MKVLLSTSECAKRIGCSVDSVYKLYDKGTLKGFTLGRHRRIFQESLDSYLQENGLYAQKFEGWFAERYPQMYKRFYSEYLDSRV